MFNIPSDPYLYLAFWTGVGAFSLTLLFVLLIIGYRLYWRWLEHHEEAFMALWQPLLMRLMMGDDIAALPRLHRRDHWLFLKLWNHFQESLRGNATARLGEVAFRLGCDTMARELLQRGNRTEQLFAILTLGHMRDRSAWASLCTQLIRPNRNGSLYAARALIQIDATEGARVVVPHLLQRDDWEMARVAVLLQEYRDALGQELVPGLPDLPPARRLRALRLAEALHLQVPCDILLPWLQPDQPADLLMAALRLAPGQQALVAVRTLADHPDWRVRVQVARALGRLGDPLDAMLLVRMVTDAQWWVRYRAAQALASLPFTTPEQLRGMLMSLPDRYAREITAQVLAEAAGAPP